MRIFWREEVLHEYNQMHYINVWETSKILIKYISNN